MMDMSKSLPHYFHIIDRTESVLTGDILLPFAVDELLCRRVGAGDRRPLVHIWRHRRALVLGLRDRRLPESQRAMNHMSQRGYSVTVRHSGGAVVPLDSGVVNISLIMAKQPGDLAFNPYFDLMYRLLQRTLIRFGLSVKAGEINGSYCPGEYDLSIGGRKFCGLAQRRQTRAFVVQAFVTVEGSGVAQAEVARDFYRIAAGEDHLRGDRPGVDFPHVIPETMTSLQQVDATLDVQCFVAALTDELRQSGGLIYDGEDFGLEPHELEQMVSHLRAHYEKRGTDFD